MHNALPPPAVRHGLRTHRFPSRAALPGHALGRDQMSTVGHPPTDRAGKVAAVRIRRMVNDEIARIGATFQARRLRAGLSSWASAAIFAVRGSST